jgi:hypothetical protein
MGELQREYPAKGVKFLSPKTEPCLIIIRGQDPPSLETEMGQTTDLIGKESPRHSPWRALS